MGKLFRLWVSSFSLGQLHLGFMKEFPENFQMEILFTTIHRQAFRPHTGLVNSFGHSDSSEPRLFLGCLLTFMPLICKLPLEASIWFNAELCTGDSSGRNFLVSVSGASLNLQDEQFIRTRQNFLKSFRIPSSSVVLQAQLSGDKQCYSGCCISGYQSNQSHTGRLFTILRYYQGFCFCCRLQCSLLHSVRCL